MYSLLLSLADNSRVACLEMSVSLCRHTSTHANTKAVVEQPVRDEIVFKLVLLPFLITAQSSPSPVSGGGVQKGMAAPALDPSGPVAPPFQAH